MGIGDQGGHSDSGNEGGDEMSQEVTGNSTQYFDAMDKSVVLPDGNNRVLSFTRSVQ